MIMEDPLELLKQHFLHRRMAYCVEFLLYISWKVGTISLIEVVDCIADRAESL